MRSGDDSGNSTVAALHWKIDERFGENIMVFDPQFHLPLRDALKPGQCTVLQLNEVDQRDQQVIVATLLRRIYNARVDTDRGKVSEGNERFLPYPVFVLIEEAHHFAPHGDEVVSTQIIKQILAEGRKFGVGVGLISQRPGKLDADALSQCLTQCIMRIVNEVDQQSVRAAVEGVGARVAGQPARALQGPGDHRLGRRSTRQSSAACASASPHTAASPKTPPPSGAATTAGRPPEREREGAILHRDARPFSIFKGEDAN